MPKKPTAPQSPETIRSIANTLQENSAALAGLAIAIEQSGFTELQISNYDQLKRSLEYLDNFVHAVRSSLRSAREDRGDFLAGNNKKKKKPG